MRVMLCGGPGHHPFKHYARGRKCRILLCMPWSTPLPLALPTSPSDLATSMTSMTSMTFGLRSARPLAVYFAEWGRRGDMRQRRPCGCYKGAEVQDANVCRESPRKRSNLRHMAQSSRLTSSHNKQSYDQFRSNDMSRVQDVYPQEMSPYQGRSA